MVYLTTAYAPYFAGCAMEEVGDLLGIVEIETDYLDGFDLHPDEDFLEQATRSPEAGPHLAPVDADMLTRTAFYRENLENFQHHWDLSVEGLGNCAHQGEVPVEAITRIALVDAKQAPHVLQIAMDPCITLMNYMICGHKYRSLLGWIFGEEITPTDLMFFDHPDAPPVIREQAERLAKILKSRDGVELLSAVTA